MHADEKLTNEALVRRLLASQFPRWAGLEIARVPSAGTDNALYRIGHDMIVRLPRIHWAVESVAKEQRWLPRLAPHLPVAIPSPLVVGAPGEGFPWPWSIYRWLDGENPAVGSLSDPAALTADLASFVAALHRIDPSYGPHAERGGPLGERDADTRTAIAQLEGTIDTGAVTAAWEDALGIAPWTRPAVWIHGDLAPGNLLCRHGRLYAVIDFGCVGVGDPAVDMLIAWTLLPANVRETYRAALGVDRDTWLRGRGWALSIALIQLPYYRRSNPELAASARHVIREVLADVAAGGG